MNSLILEIQCSAVSIAQLKGGAVVLHHEHLLLGEQLSMSINGRAVDFFFGDDVKKKKRKKEIIVKTLDLVDAIRFSSGPGGTGRYVWDSVQEQPDPNHLMFEVYSLPTVKGDVLEKVTYRGRRPDVVQEAFEADFEEIRILPVTDEIFSRHPLHFA